MIRARRSAGTSILHGADLLHKRAAKRRPYGFLCVLRR